MKQLIIPIQSKYVKIGYIFITSKKLLVIIVLLFFFNSASFLHAKNTNAVSPWSVIMAENLMDNPSIAHNSMLHDYVFSTAMKGLRELWKATNDTIYFQYISDIVGNYLLYYTKLPDLSYFDMDIINGASLILFLYSETGDSKYIPAIDSTIAYLYSFPRTTNGGILHKALTNLQLDDLYMIAPFMAEYGIIFNKPEVYQDGVKQALLFKKYMRDKETGLMYHAWYDGSFGETSGCTPYFWGRGIGWVAMALVDMLDFLPESYSERDSVITMLQDLSLSISNVQDPNSAIWWQIVDKWSVGNNYPESSASCMFVYAIAKGIRLSYLDNTYLPVIEKGIQGITDNFLEVVDTNTINITSACPGQGPSFNLNTYFGSTANNVHAVGPFISACLETYKLGINPIVNVNQLSSNNINIYNYPNPARNATTIYITLKESNYVNLNVYNKLGQFVGTIFNGYLSEGNHSIIYYLNNKSNGVYFYKLQTGNKILTNKMIFY